jgi:hypothetical protein
VTDEQDRHEREIAGVLLLSERRAQRELTRVVKERSLAFAVAVQDGATGDRLHRTLRRHIDELADDAEEAVTAARTDAREKSSNKQLQVILTLLSLLGASKEEAIATRRKTVSAVGRLPSMRSADAVSSRIAAQHLANSWGNAVLRTVERARSDRPLAPGRASSARRGSPSAGPYRTPAKADDHKAAASVARNVPRELEPAIRRIAATEVGVAHNAEAKRVVETLPADVAIRVEMVWSAILDRRTCEICGSKDGTVITTEWPPAHGNCRCVAVPRRPSGTVRRSAPAAVIPIAKAKPIVKATAPKRDDAAAAKRKAEQIASEKAEAKRVAEEAAEKARREELARIEQAKTEAEAKARAAAIVEFDDNGEVVWADGEPLPDR